MSTASNVALHQAALQGPAILLIVVEGRHDVEFLTRISSLLHASDPLLPDLAVLEQQERIIFLPAGGGDFRPWLTRLKPFGCAEFHLYDREMPPVSEQRLRLAAPVNRRPRCHAAVTSKRSIENYLHPDAIREASGLKLIFSDHDDVAEIAARAMLTVSKPNVPWLTLSPRARRRFRDQAKIWLNTTAAQCMTVQRLAERDPTGEVAAWLGTIRRLIEGRA